MLDSISSPGKIPEQAIENTRRELLALASEIVNRKREKYSREDIQREITKALKEKYGEKSILWTDETVRIYDQGSHPQQDIADKTFQVNLNIEFSDGIRIVENLEGSIE